jgi:hypothetical protein
MGQIGFFELETPQDVREQIEAQIGRLRQGNAQQQAAANSQQVINALFGSPQMRQAEAKATALTEALGSVTKDAGESEFDFQIRQAQAVRERLAGTAPELSVQANDRLIALQAEQLEQASLKQDFAIDKLTLEEKQFTAAQGKRAVIFEQTLNGNIPVRFLDPDATDDEIIAARNELAAKFPNKNFDIGNGLDALKLDDAGAATTGVINKSTKAEYLGALDNAASFARGLAEVTSRIVADPLILSSAGTQLATGGDLINSVTKVYNDFLGENVEVQTGVVDANTLAKANQGRIDAALERSGFIKRAVDEGADAATARAIVTNLAYTLAKALDPGGRLSDQDVEMAMRMLLGNGDPNAILELFDARLRETNASMATAREYASNGVLDGNIGRNAVRRLDSDIARTRDLLTELQSSITAGNLLKNTQVAPSAKRPDDPEIQAKRDRLRARLQGGQ